MKDTEIKSVLETVKTIALVGASEKVSRPSYGVMAYLLEQDYEVIPVSPKLARQELHEHRSVCITMLTFLVRPHVRCISPVRGGAYEVAKEAIAIGAKVLRLQIGVINEQAVVLAKKTTGLKSL
ncbi:MAG: CoA-binding protein [Candidatus Malihini olakiniferum]